MRCRAEMPGLLGRASVAHRAAQDVEDAATVGAAGVDALLADASGHMVALTPLGSPALTKESGSVSYNSCGSSHYNDEVRT